MKQIPLSSGKYAIVDDDDFDRLNQFTWSCSHANHGRPYAYRTVWSAPRIELPKLNGKRQRKRIGTDILEYMHHSVLGIDSSIEIDHKNGDSLDNRKDNLRICSHTENVRNSKIRINNSSGYKGVYWKERNTKWCAQINVDNKKVYLGLFGSKEEAYEAYKIAAIKYHGEFARWE